MSSTSASDGDRPGPGGSAPGRSAGAPRPGAPASERSRATVVPHVVGHHIDVALRMLTDLGLRARVVTTEIHEKTDRHVVSTHPTAGTPAERDALVEVVMGIAPTVAHYVGHDADDAVRLAEVAGHVVEVVLADRDGARRTTDVVVAQEPAAGERSRVLLLRVGPAPTGADEPTSTP